MKVTIQQTGEGEDEIILRYREMTPEISSLIHLLRQGTPVITGREGERSYRVAPGDIYQNAHAAGLHDAFGGPGAA